MTNVTSETTSAQPRRSGTQAALTLSVINVVAVAAGFGREAAIAGFFGTGAGADAFAITLFYVEALSVVIFTGLASYMLVPITTGLLISGDRDDAFRLMETLLLRVLVVAFPAVAVGVLQPQIIAAFIAPEFSAAQSRYLTLLLPLGCLSLIPIVAAGIGSGLLRASGWYEPVVYGRAVFSIGIATVLLAGVRRLGLAAAAWGLMGGALAQLAVLFVALWRLGWRPRVPRWTHRCLREAVGTGLLTTTAVVATNILMGGAQRYVASGLPEGSFAAVNYAQRTLSLVSGLTISFMTVALTELSASYLTEGGLGVRTTKSLLASLRIGLFILTPLSVFLAMVANPLTALLFQRGRYTAQSVLDTADCLRWLTVSIVPGMFFGVCAGAAFPAFRRPWFVVIAGAVLMAATVGSTATLLRGTQMLALPLGSSIGFLVGSGICAVLLWTVTGTAPLSNLGKYALRTALCALGSYVATRAAIPYDAVPTTAIEAAATISKTGLSFVLAFLALSAATRDEHIALAWNKAVNHFSEKGTGPFGVV